jgi:tRNA pseudouridine38-40 synthase
MHRPLQQRNYVYHCWHVLDIARMNAAAARLVGRHDFAGFAAAGNDRVTTVRTIFACGVEEHGAEGVMEGEYPGTPGRYRGPKGREVHIVVQGDGFLYNMVRIIAGTLLEIGRGAIDPERIDQALASGDRRLAGPTLPPQGLCLEWICYDGEQPPGA